MAKKSESKSKSTFTPGKGKTWSDKLGGDKLPEVRKNEKGFADIPPGSTMLIATAKIVDDYVRQIPKGKEVTLQTMRKDLAVQYNAEYSCPVVSGILLRIVAEASHEQYSKGKAISKITPFWRMIDENSTIGKKVSFGPEFIKAQRKKERIGTPKSPKGLEEGI
jgi:hypothetical protein